MSLYAQKSNDSARLHQPHQVRGEAGNHYALYFPFSSIAFGSESVIELQSVPMEVDDAYLVFSQAVLATTTSPGLVQTPFYISSQGVQLRYADQTVYTMTPEECYSYPIINAKNEGEVLRFLQLINEGQVPAIKGKDQKNDAAGLRFIPLKPMVDKWLSQIGPLSAYPAGKWSISAPFVTSLASVATSASDSTAATGGAISGLNLLLTGHSENSENAGRFAKALSDDGVEFTFLQPVQFSQTTTAGDDTAQILMNSLQGDLDNMVVMERVTANLISTTPDTNCKTQWALYPLATDTISVGTSSNPTYLYGKPLPQELLRLGVMGRNGVSFGGSYISRGSPIIDDPITENGDLPRVVNTSIKVLNCSENSSMSQEVGAYSGSVRVFNDWQMNYAFGSSGNTADTITVIAYLRKKAVVSYGGVSISDE